MLKTDKIFIAGHRGMVGSSLFNLFQKQGFLNLIVRTRTELDLSNQAEVFSFLKKECPSLVIVAAARVGGIHANNTYPAEFLYENLAIAQNTIHGSYQAGVKHLLFLGSSCIYPRQTTQPLREDYLLSSQLESTNEAYALAKIAGLKLCQFYRKQYGVLYHSAMPTNLYGPGDNYHPENSHVLPGLIRRFHEAKERQAPEVTIWGTGGPLRELLHVEDLASAIYHLLNIDNPPDWINIGTGTDITISELAELVKTTIGYTGKIVQDTTKPDGSPRKLLDISKMRALGWEAKIDLKEGILRTYQDFLDNHAQLTLNC